MTIQMQVPHDLERLIADAVNSAGEEEIEDAVIKIQEYRALFGAASGEGALDVKIMQGFKSICDPIFNAV